MRTKVVIPAKSISDARLTGREFKILTALCFFDPECTGDAISPERSQLTVLTGIKEDHISRGLSRLESCGWVSRVKVGRKGVPSTYQVNWSMNPSNIVSILDTLSADKVSNLDILPPDKMSKTDSLSSSQDVQNGHLKNKVSNLDILSADKVSKTDTHDHDDHIYNIDHDEIVAILKEKGVSGNLDSGRASVFVKSWIETGITESFLVRSIEHAFAHCKNGVPGVGYIDKVITTLKAQITDAVTPSSEEDREQITSLATTYQLTQGSDETWKKFKSRVLAHHRDVLSDRQHAERVASYQTQGANS